MRGVLLCAGFIFALLLLILGWWTLPLLIFVIFSALCLRSFLFSEDWRLGYILIVAFSLVLLFVAGEELAFAVPGKSAGAALIEGALLVALGVLINFAAYGFTSIIYVEAGHVEAGEKPTATLRHGWMSQHLLSAFTPIIGMGRAFMIATGLYPLSVHVIKDGKSTFPLPKKEGGDTLGLLGPSFVVVNKGTVVVTERFGRFKRIADRFFTSEPFEYSMAAINVRPQTDAVKVEGLLTRDGVAVEVELLVRYQIRRGSAEGRYDEFTWDDLLAYDPEAVLAAAFKVDDWQKAVRDQTVLRAQEVVARYTLDDISDPAMRRTASGVSSPREEVVEEIRERLESDVAQWGVEILEMAIKDVEIARRQPGVLRTVRRYREVTWERAIRELRAETDRLVTIIAAEGDRAAIEERARAQETLERVLNAALADNLRQFLQAVTKPEVEGVDKKLLTRYVAALEKVTWLLHSGDSVGIYMVELLEKIAENPETTTTFLPSGISISPSIEGRGSPRLPSGIPEP